MIPIVLAMNDVLRDWKQRHDVLSAIHTEFSVEQDFICFGGHPLFKADNNLCLERAEFDAESIRFFLPENCSIEIYISWPEDAPPAIASVLL